MDTLTELLEEQIKDLYSAENQLAKALPKLARKASTEALKAGFQKHTQETLIHIERLGKVAEMLEIKPTGKVCKAMKGLIEEGKEVLEEDGHALVIDAALIAAAQRVEHYEISAYGTAKALAKQLGKNDVFKLLETTEKEEVVTDSKLTEVAAKFIMGQAPQDEESEDEE